MMLTWDQMERHYPSIPGQSIQERENPDSCFYPGSKKQFCLWVNRAGGNPNPLPAVRGVCIGLHKGRHSGRQARVEIELKIRLSGSPASRQHHIFLMTSLQMWGFLSLGRQLLARPATTYGTTFALVRTASIFKPRQDKTC